MNLPSKRLEDSQKVIGRFFIFPLGIPVKYLSNFIPIKFLIAHCNEGLAGTCFSKYHLCIPTMQLNEEKKQ